MYPKKPFLASARVLARLTEEIAGRFIVETIADKDPMMGEIMVVGTGGCRKSRALPGAEKEKSGGYRTVHYTRKRTMFRSCCWWCWTKGTGTI